MGTVIINIRADSKLKRQAMKVAGELGFNLSSIIKGFLTELVRTKRIDFEAAEDPSPRLIRVLNQAKKDIEMGKTSPAFDNVKDAIRWLEDKKFRKSYGNRVQERVSEAVRQSTKNNSEGFHKTATAI